MIGRMHCPGPENAARCDHRACRYGGCQGRTPLPTLDSLADRVDRLGPSRRNPEQFHIEKGEIAAELRRLAREAKPW